MVTTEIGLFCLQAWELIPDFSLLYTILTPCKSTRAICPWLLIMDMFWIGYFLFFFLFWAYVLCLITEWFHILTLVPSLSPSFPYDLCFGLIVSLKFDFSSSLMLSSTYRGLSLTLLDSPLQLTYSNYDSGKDECLQGEINFYFLFFLEEDYFKCAVRKLLFLTETWPPKKERLGKWTQSKCIECNVTKVLSYT